MPKSNTLHNYDLTYEQAHAIASGLDRCDLSGGSDQDIGLLLALLRAFTYGDNRESLLCAVEAALLPLVQCAGVALDDLIKHQMATVRSEARKGGAR